jgi:hypothetical protein
MSGTTFNAMQTHGYAAADADEPARHVHVRRALLEEGHAEETSSC